MSSDKTGRSQVDIDWQMVGKLLEADCKTTDIAGQLGINRTTLYRRCKADLGITFTTFCQQKKGSGDNLLRAKQYQMAVSGNVTMLIWLGKQRLAQSEKQEITGKDGGPMQMNIDFAALTVEQLKRIADGESIASVIAG